jgi:hypothetical protein
MAVEIAANFEPRRSAVQGKTTMPSVAAFPIEQREFLALLPLVQPPPSALEPVEHWAPEASPPERHEDIWAEPPMGLQVSPKACSSMVLIGTILGF